MKELGLSKNTEASFLVLSAVEKYESQLELAKSLDFSVGKVNYILKSLVDKGFVKMGNYINSNHKRKYSYLLTPEGIRRKIALTESFIERKKEEYERLQYELEQDRMRLNIEDCK